jgi:hypothetical protein
MLTVDTPSIRTDTRERRGLALYLHRGCEFVRVSRETFLVPSCTRRRHDYLVDLEKGSCECFDNRERGHHCKHLFAALCYRATLRRRARAIAPVLMAFDVEGL